MREYKKAVSGLEEELMDETPKSQENTTQQKSDSYESEKK